MATDYGSKRDRIARYGGFSSWEEMSAGERQNASQQYNKIYNNDGSQKAAYQNYSEYAGAPGQADGWGTGKLPMHDPGGVNQGGGNGGMSSEEAQDASGWLDKFINDPEISDTSKWLIDAYDDMRNGGDGLSGTSMLEGDWLQQAFGKTDAMVQENWAEQKELLSGLTEQLGPIMQSLKSMYDAGMTDIKDFNEVADGIMENISNDASGIRDQYEKTFRPMIDKMAKEAQDYASPERQRSAMGEAASDVARAQDAQRESTLRNLESYGIDPSQTRHQAIDANLRAERAAAQAAAANQAQRDVENTGWSRQQDAIQAGLAGQQMVGNAAGLDQAVMGVNQGKLTGNIQGQENLRQNLAQQLDINQLQATYGAQWQQVANMMIDKQIAEMGLETDRRRGIDQFNLNKGALNLDWANAMAGDQRRGQGIQFDYNALKSRENLTREGHDLKWDISKMQDETQRYGYDQQASAANAQGQGAMWGGVLDFASSFVPFLAEGGHVEGKQAIPTGRSSPSMHPQGQAVKLDSGGHIQGQGGPKSDSIPAMVSNDEYVIPAEVVKKKGTDFFDKLITKQQEELQAKQRSNGVAPPQQITDSPAAGPGAPAPQSQAIPMGAR